MQFLNIYFGFCLFICFINLLLAKISCKNENRINIDWFVAIKFPNSFDFVYLSSDNDNLEWKRSTYGLQSDRNMVALTLEQTHSATKDKSFYIYYNDDRPNVNSSSAGGHLKGALNMDQNTGFWLIHSIPNFPSENNYIFGSSQSVYGQSLICISIRNIYLKAIIQQLSIMYSTVYSSNLPQDFSRDQELMEQLRNTISNSRRTKSFINKIELETVNSLKLIHFAKSSKYDKDLYSGFIAPSLNGSLFVETWKNGRGNKLQSECQYKHKINNVVELSLLSKSFKSTSDHSKWAISQNHTNPYVCVSDINRMQSQFKRGGGSLCISKPEVWQRLYDSVKSYEKC